jgi:hypothetical protein
LVSKGVFENAGWIEELVHDASFNYSETQRGWGEGEFFGKEVEDNEG